MNICKNCGCEHDGSYGSGIFCSKHCRYVYIGKQKKKHICNWPSVTKKNLNQNINEEDRTCQFCGKILKSKIALIAHKVRCKQNPNKKHWHTRKGKNVWKDYQSWNKGLSKETDQRLLKTSNTYKKNFKTGKIKNIGHTHTKETKEYLSQLRVNYLNSAQYISKPGGMFKFVKKHKVKNLLGKQVLVQRTWEYNVALKLNENNILWQRGNTISYIDAGVNRKYIPDFYLPELNEYIEVKGYFSDKNKNKMNLVVLQNPNIKIKFILQKDYQLLLKDINHYQNIPYYQFMQ